MAVKPFLRTYVFDVDHNLSTLDRIIFLEKDGEGYECPSRILTEKLSEWYTRKNGHMPDATGNFRDDGIDGVDAFPKFMRETIEHQAYGPSMDKFVEAVLMAAPIAVNTARAHAPSSIQAGIQVLIEGVLIPAQLQQMHDAIRSMGWSTYDSLSEALHDYLTQQYYICVSEDAFFDANALSSTLSSAARKAIAFPAIIEHMCAIRDKFHGWDKTSMSIGFSDDEKPNISAIVSRWEWHKDALEAQGIHFVCYDMSGEREKVRVTRKVMKESYTKND